MRQEQPSKAILPYEEDPLTVVYSKGSQVVGKRAESSTITRTIEHFKPVPYQSIEEVNDWELGRQAKTAVTCDKCTSEPPEQSQAVDAPLPKTPPRQAHKARNGVSHTADLAEVEGVGGERGSENQPRSTCRPSTQILSSS